MRGNLIVDCYRGEMGHRAGEGGRGERGYTSGDKLPLRLIAPSLQLHKKAPSLPHTGSCDGEDEKTAIMELRTIHTEGNENEAVRREREK